MTVIAWDGRMVAADGLGVADGRRSFRASEKIVEKDGVVYATTGRMGPLQDAWIAWYEAGADPANPPPQGGAAEDCGNFIVFKHAKCFIFSHVVPYACEEVAPCAFGSGGDYAMGAMIAGADAERAVEIAIMCDVNCGGPITKFVRVSKDKEA